MSDNRRRNRNIGTVKQGHGQNNRMRILDQGLLHYTERLTEYKRFAHTINGHEFIFVVKKNRANCYHACSVADVASIHQDILNDQTIYLFNQDIGIFSDVFQQRFCYAALRARRCL
jgi:hypothetical protein